MPKGDIGRIGLAISPVNPDYVFAIIEAREKGGFYKSTNRGASWKKTNDYKTSSAQYYNEIFCDPKDVDKIYSLDTRTKVSIDGGKTFNNVGNKARHVDDHALWINPDNTDHFLIGGDGREFMKHSTALKHGCSKAIFLSHNFTELALTTLNHFTGFTAAHKITIVWECPHKQLIMKA